MRTIKLFYFLVLCAGSVFAQNAKSRSNNVEAFQNQWIKQPSRIPNTVSIDAPLMGNGDVTMSVGYKGNTLRYYVSKNDFWRLKSQSDNLSGPRVVSFLDIEIEGLDHAGFTAQQQLKNGITTCLLNKNGQQVEVKSWVSATTNLIFVELTAINKEAKVAVYLTGTENSQAIQKRGANWLTRAFIDNVDIASEVAVAYKTINSSGNTRTLKPGETIRIALAVESNFKNEKPLAYVLDRLKKVNENTVSTLLKQHNKWWDGYWRKSSVSVEDTVLMKAYYQGLYTMAACSRDPKFPPGIFGWNTTDKPAWNGDYHLNYNFQAPFYALTSSNRLEQAIPHDAPLLDFMPRGEWYAKNVTHTRGILYPVGIGPLGIEVTKDHPGYITSKNAEQGGLFFGQRSNAAYGLLNMAQYWRCTYDINYGKKIYPYALAVANFWEDYLKLENGRYVIYGDAIHEGSGNDKNPILSLGLVRNAFNLILDLSTTLKIDENRQGKWAAIVDKLSDFPVQIRKDKKVFRYTEEGTAWWGDNGLGIQHIYPSNGITLDSKTEWLTIAHNTIDEMQRWQDTNTSSSFFVAAIRVGYNPSVILNELHNYALHTYPNGFQLNNPHGIENSGVVANALNEMLCMSVGNTIRLFGDFPKNKDASFKNIRAWGAFLVSASLTNERVSKVKIFSEKGRVCAVINPWPDKKVRLIRNGKEAEVLEGHQISFKTRINETLELKQL